MSEDFDYDVVAKDPLEEADDGASERGIRKIPNPDAKECPVVPLGFTGGKVVFAMPEGEIRFEPAAKIGAMLRVDIFACSAGQNFLTYWRGEDDKFLRDLASVWFVRKCREAGLWDANRPIRSLGVWPADEERIVLHVGDEIWRLKARGKPEKLSIIEALRERSGPLYKLRPPAPRPAKAASAGDGQWVRDQLDLWRFEAIGDEGLTGADVVFGWTGASMLGAVAPFRGHLSIDAMAGSGKSTLVEFVHAVQSSVTGDVIDAFTEAGLRNELAGNARSVLIDEAESSPGVHGAGVVEKALELLRRMSTGSGGTRKQGDIGGGSVTQTAVGAALLAAINPPKLGPADASRFVQVRLLPLTGALTARADLQAAIAKAGELAPRFLGRVLSGAWRYRSDVAEIASALVRAGESPRTADLMSMLAAGRRLLLHDDALTPETADAEVRFWRPLLVQREAAEVVSNPGADALAHLLATDSGMHNHGQRRTLGELVEQCVKERADWDGLLATFGLRIDVKPAADGRPGPWLLVSNHHPRLAGIFGESRWPDYRRTLVYLEALGPEFKTWPTPNSLRFGMGPKQRALAIPLTPLIEGANRPAAGMATGVTPLRSETVPPAVPEEDVDWPE